MSTEIFLSDNEVTDSFFVKFLKLLINAIYSILKWFWSLISIGKRLQSHHFFKIDMLQTIFGQFF